MCREIKKTDGAFNPLLPMSQNFNHEVRRDEKIPTYFKKTRNNLPCLCVKKTFPIVVNLFTYRCYT